MPPTKGERRLHSKYGKPVELDEPYVLIHEKKLTGLQTMLPLLEAVVKCPLCPSQRAISGRAVTSVDDNGDHANSGYSGSPSILPYASAHP